MRSPLRGSAMLPPAHLLVTAIVLVTLCSCAATPARLEQPIADHAHMLQTRLIEEDWMLYSWVYPAITNEGYPINFLTNGRVKTRNLPPVETWQVTQDLTLQLTSIDHAPIMALSYDSDAGVFVFQPFTGPRFVVGPQGFHFEQYVNKLAVQDNSAR